MKKVFSIIIVLLGLTTVSCGSVASTIQKNEKEVAGYTLKSKTELMQQKIVNLKPKTIIAIP